MKDKNNKLDSLFNDWGKEVSFYNKAFVKDGIINEEEFDNANIKILYIYKEPNDPNKDSWDFREQWGEKEKFYYTFAYRIAEWSHGRPLELSN
jgi:hypothetical protein